jgi:hypothetical protein
VASPARTAARLTSTGSGSSRSAARSCLSLCSPPNGPTWSRWTTRTGTASARSTVSGRNAPPFALTDPATGGIRLLGLVSDDSPVARIKGSDWPATPADRLAQLCRHHGVELGLATDGRW